MRWRKNERDKVRKGTVQEKNRDKLIVPGYGLRKYGEGASSPLSASSAKTAKLINFHFIRGDYFC